MSEELVKSVQEMLKEEKWTRATISNYTKNNLMELSKIVEKAKEENCTAEIKAICDEQLTNSKDSIIALYFSGIFALKQGAINNEALTELVDIFEKNHKEDVVVYLCESILADDASNKFALRTLANCYKAEGSDKIWALYEKIVKVDFEEAEIAKLLAEHYESNGDKDKAVDYYKKALLRFVNRKNVNAIKDIWTILVDTIPTELDFFLLVQRKIARSMDAERSASLMEILYAYYKKEQNWDVAISILKLNLGIDPKDGWARKELIECYRGKFAKNPNTEEYIRGSNLSQSWRNVFEAINDFEKHIAFSAKHFVFHKSWGVGVIRKVENDTLTINFGANGVREMKLAMAVNALQPLPRKHIWVQKAIKSQDELKKYVKENVAETLEMIITSFDNSCDYKKIKAELVPAILTNSEWTSWNNKAKKELEENSKFAVNPNSISEYTVRDNEISTEEKLSNEFKAQKQFFSRVAVLARAVKAIEDGLIDDSSELFADMYNYFVGFLKSFTGSNINEQIVASYLVVERIGVQFPNLKYTCGFTFEEMFSSIENPSAMYSLLKDSKSTSLQQDFLTKIELLPNWYDIYIDLFPTVLSGQMLEKLVAKGHSDKVQALAKKAFEDTRTYHDAIIFMFENCQDAEWFKEANISYEKQLISLINIIAQCYREIDGHVYTTENRKVIKNASALLFDNDTLLNFMMECDKDKMGHFYTLVNDIKDLEPSVKAVLRNKILEKYPDYKFHTTTEDKAQAPKGMMVLASSKEAKEARKDEIEKVEIPANAKELADARAQGDLKENAEYIAAKEAQHRLGNELKRLTDDLARAVIFDPTTATTSVISFGTTVTLLNKDTNKEEVLSIFGPWESDPDKNIISYMSPVGNKLLNHKVGDDFGFEVNGKRYNYVVKTIAIAKL